MTEQSPGKNSLQFSLATMLRTVFVTAVALAILRFSFLLGLVAISLAAILMFAGKHRLLVAELLIVLFCCGLLVALLLPAVGGGGVSRRSMCRNNLRQIGLALYNYHEIWGSFPPAIVRDQRGRPMHSWRVLILPYLESQALYDAYRFDEPWNGPHNRMLAGHVPDVYICPADEEAKPNEMTSMVALIGNRMAWPPDGVRSTAEFSDGRDTTVLVAEVINSGIHWMEPRDLHELQTVSRINPKAGQGISSRHGEGANVLLADGTVQFLPQSLDTETLTAMLTVCGGERFKRDRQGNILDWEFRLVEPHSTSRSRRTR